ncbi:MAG: tetratricopeptide repeat protein, partial [Muribaculaceae bacterium]|nr:tetratricopeptide repeat protein [Muribaculaceae bacterium]
LKYQQALKENPSSAVARYNLGLSQIRLGSNPSDTTQAAKDMLANGAKAMEQISQLGREKPQLASRANYNLGNIAFNSEDYSNALNYYKQSLRLNPNDEAARRNLRITQLKLQNQNQDQNQDQQQNQDQNQDQNKDQNQDQNKDQQQDQNKDQQQDQNKDQQQNQPDINQQTADQILKAMENKENQTRARVSTGNQGDKSTAKNRTRKNW